MARGPIFYIVQKTNGDAVSGATLTVAIRGAGPATVYANETGGTLAGSPLLTDVDGKVTAWLDEGSYDITASGAGITTTTRAIEILRGDATMAKSATTAAVDTNTQQLATTAFVVGQASSVLPVIDGTATIGTSLRYARADHIHPTDSSRAPLASPSFTGLPLAPTQGSTDNSTRIATTAFVKSLNYLNRFPGGYSKVDITQQGVTALSSSTFVVSLTTAAYCIVTLGQNGSAGVAAGTQAGWWSVSGSNVTIYNPNNFTVVYTVLTIGT